MKQIFATLMIFISSLIFTIPASAEFRLGATIGSSSLAGDIVEDAPISFAGTERSGSGGIFGQWRGPASDTVDIGIHLGYSSESADARGELGTLTDGVITATDVIIELESDSITDLMGIIVWKGGSVKPFIMAGLSSLKIDSTARGTISGVRMTDSADDSATGFKMAIGMEWPIGESLNGHVLIDYVDYGEIELYNNLIEFEAQQTGIKLGLAYSF